MREKPQSIHDTYTGLVDLFPQAGQEKTEWNRFLDAKFITGHPALKETVRRIIRGRKRELNSDELLETILREIELLIYDKDQGFPAIYTISSARKKITDQTQNNMKTTQAKGGEKAT